MVVLDTPQTFRKAGLKVLFRGPSAASFRFESKRTSLQMSSLGQVGAGILEGTHPEPMKLANLPFKLESEFFRAWFRMTGGRPGSHPYVSGDGFRAITDWVYEPTTADSFSLKQVASQSLGFCDGWLLQDFLKNIAPQIQVPYRLISHNADPNVTAEVLGLVPDSLQTLYTTNCLADSSRVVSLPIGLENARYHYNGVVADFEKLRRRQTPRKSRILAAFTVGTNTRVRKPALETLSCLPTVDVLPRINSRAYREIAVGYQFIASPSGNGEDCHRTWESLYLGAIPIVVRSVMTEGFRKRGLPLWLVDSYDELIGLDEASLAARYHELSPGLNSRWLWMDEWIGLINEERP